MWGGRRQHVGEKTSTLRDVHTRRPCMIPGSNTSRNTPDALHTQRKENPRDVPSLALVDARAGANVLERRTTLLRRKRESAQAGMY
mgnify:CR=1 FL=1